MAHIYKADLEQKLILPITSQMMEPPGATKSRCLPHYMLAVFNAQSLKVAGGRVLEITKKQPQ